MEENKYCYTFEEILFDDEFLPAVDVTYIIHLEGNGREQHIQEQLKEYHPTKRIFILHNQGFKQCEKKGVNKSCIDIVDAFLQIFKHAQEQQYDNILILEDDFVFSEKMKDPYHQNNVNGFIKENKDTEFMYLLGCIPSLVIPCTYTTYKIFQSGGMHSVIYSKQQRTTILQQDQSSIVDWDDFNPLKTRYMYYLPLCYQLFPETENMNHWAEDTPFIIFAPITKYVIKLLYMDKQVEPGYSIFYGFSKALFWILLIFFLYLVYQGGLLIQSIILPFTSHVTVKTKERTKK